MIPGIFTDYQADQLVKETVQRIVDHIRIPTIHINSVEIQHDMVVTPRLKVGSGPKENWLACDSAGAKKVTIPAPKNNKDLEWVVS